MLSSRGIYAQLIQLPPDSTGQVSYRHLHVCEVALLNGVPVDLDWSDDHRLNLCAIGQMAAPLQSMWIASHIAQHVVKEFGTGKPKTPQEHVMAFKQQLWHQVKQVYPDIPRNIAPAAAKLVLIHGHEGTHHHVRVQAGSLASHLMHAECALSHTAPQEVILCDAQGTAVDLNMDVSACSDLWIRWVTTPNTQADSPDLPDLWDDLPSNDTEHAQPAVNSTPAEAPPMQVDPSEPQPEVSSPGLDSLLHLEGHQLLNMIPPLVCDSHLCHAMRSQCVPTQPRVRLLHKQGNAWGDDELFFQFARLHQACHDQGIVFLDPLLVTSWAQTLNLHTMSEFFAQFSVLRKVVSVVLFRGHWTPYVWEIHHDKLQVSSYDHTAADINPMNALHGALCQALGLKSFEAHMQVTQATNITEAWKYWSNAAVDAVARQANQQRSPEFWQTWELYASQLEVAQHLHQECFELQLEVAKLSVLQTVEDMDVPQSGPTRQTRVFEMIFDEGPWSGEAPRPVLQEYGAAMVDKLTRWWVCRTRGDNTGEPRWITFAHLYVDWQMTWGHAGPIKFKKQWLDQSNRPYLEVEQYTFCQRLKWFRRFLKFFWQHSGIKVGLTTCKGAGEAIHSFVASASLYWNQWAFTCADEWLLRHTKAPCLKGTKVLEHLPIAAQLSGLNIEPAAPCPG
eukprot:Skav230729  [mRNA]  locus=scaffold401:500269:508647:- [translate_table: standard]